MRPTRHSAIHAIRSSLTVVRNWRATAAIIFVVWHLAAMLAAGLAEPARSALMPLFGWYADGLCMTNRFSMFARPPNKAVLVVMGQRRRGPPFEMATSASHERTWRGRIVDARLRKVQHRLLDEGARQQWGHAYLAWFCREGAAHGVVRVLLELHAADELDDHGNVTQPARRELLLVQRCKQIKPIL